MNPSAREWAYGGHALSHVTGIFAIPTGSAAERMPGIRYYMSVDIGECFGPAWDTVFGPKKRRTPRPSLTPTTSRLSLTPSIEKSSPGTPSSPYSRSSSDLRSTSVLTLGAEEDPFRDPPEEDIWEDDGGISDGTRYMTKSQRRAFRILEAMKKETDWSGANYNLLGRNCNAFTDELCWRLTGKRAPTWINRAAWVATTVPCLVPPGWIDESDEPDTTESDPSQQKASVVIAPPRADRMDLGGSAQT